MARVIEAKKQESTKKPEALVNAKEVEVDLTETIQILHKYITGSLCRKVFCRIRTKERQRVWSLFALVWFWVEVTLRAPKSLTQALEECVKGSQGWPRVAATPEAFFQRAQYLPPKFFMIVYKDFVQRIVTIAETNYGSDMEELRGAFPELWIVDGSRLDAIRHRLKILHNVRAVILPGCIEAGYDVWRGIPRIIQFSADAAKAEMTRVLEILPQIPEGALVLGDRLYANAKLFEALKEQKKFGLFRRNGTLSLRKKECLSKEWIDGGKLEDWVVEAGSGQKAPKQILRYISYKRNGVVYELLTNVLDSKKLSAVQAINLYPERWFVERMFFDVKEVLDLHQFYAANPNAVAMQVYGVALVYTAMRIAQGRIARQEGIEPEALSPAKLFPRLATASYALAMGEVVYEACCKANPGLHLQRPDLRQHGIGVVKLANILVEKRKGKRRKRRLCRSRIRWKSFAHIRGGKKLT